MSYICSRMSHFSILAGGVDVFLLKIGTSGLWSVRTVKRDPNTYRWKCRHAQVMANASLLVCEYRCSVGVSERLVFMFSVTHVYYTILSNDVLKDFSSRANAET